MDRKIMQYYERLRELRKNNNLSQKAVSQILDIPPSTYRDYEGNRRHAPVYIIIRLAKLYDCSVNYICGMSDIYGSFPEA